MLRELDDKRGKLGQNSLGPRQLNAEERKWAARRNKLNRAAEQLIDRGLEFEKLRE